MAAGTQISVILENEPGELAKLCDIFLESDINIQAMSIQNAKNYVMELYAAREKTGRRITMAEHYRGILREASTYSVIRLIVNKTDIAIEKLREHNYPIDTSNVLILTMKNEPGVLGTMSRQLSKEKINIDYVYGSAMNGAGEAIFVFHVAETDWERALEVFHD